MDIRKCLMEQLYAYHKATDIPLQLLDKEENIILSFSDKFAYCQLTEEACGTRAFCNRLHVEGCKQAVNLKEGYVFSCPAGLIHFAVPVFISQEHRYSILAGPVALEYPDIAVVDNLIQQCGCSLNYRKKLYGTLSGIPIVEPVRLQYLNQLLFSLIDNLVQAYDAGMAGNVEPDTLPVSEKIVIKDEYKIPLMEKVLDYVEKHYRENLRLDEVAKYVGLNPSYLSTLFKQELDINFSQYIIDKKIKEACRLLRETHLSLVDIAFELGFDNQSYFSRSFKKYMGMSPNQYRREK